MVETNFDHYQKELARMCVAGNTLAINKITGRPTSCTSLKCDECLFLKKSLSFHIPCNCCQAGEIKNTEWAEAEYVEIKKLQ